MANEVRTVCFDPGLKVEAYRFKGIVQKFPNHFHDYYVIGFIEKGQRCLLCNNQEYLIGSGDITIFNPRDTHACHQVDGKTLDYQCLNIQPAVMRQVFLEITGKEYLPYFRPAVLYHSDLTACLRELHQLILEESTDFRKEELFLLLIEQLIDDYSAAVPSQPVREPAARIKAVCDYLESNYTKAITLDQLSSLAGLSKYHLLRSFTRQKGISPYSYLETIRIGQAKKLLEQGLPPLEAAMRTGFSDQSHFSNFFKKFIGLTPQQYRRVFSEDAEIQPSREKRAY